MEKIDFKTMFENSKNSKNNERTTYYEEYNKIWEIYDSIREILNKKSKKHQTLEKKYQKMYSDEVNGKDRECFEEFMYNVYITKRRELDNATPVYKALNDYFENYLGFEESNFDKDDLMNAYDITEKEYKNWFK